MPIMDFSVVLPVYNEAENLKRLVESLKDPFRQLGGSYEIICVDDGSTDDSQAVLVQLAQRFAEIRIVTFEVNCGQSAALAAGLQAAKGEIVATLDSDLQNDPQDIPHMVQKIKEGNDFVCGVREKRQDTFSKRMASKIGNGVRRWFLRDHIIDTGCTLKVFRRHCISAFVYFKGAHRYFAVFAEKAGFKIAQVNVQHHARHAGKSKYSNWRRGWDGLFDLMMVRQLLKRRIPYRIKNGTH